MSLIRTVTSTRSVSPMPRCSWRSLAARPLGSSRERVSPCSSRSTMAWWSIRRRRSAPWLPADTLWDSLTKTASTSSAIASGGTRRPAAIALIVFPSALSPISASSTGGRGPAGAPGGHRADAVAQLAALGDVVFQQVAVASRTFRQQRDRVLGLLVLGQHHDPGAGMALAHLPGGVDALAAEVRRHPDIGHDH